MTFLRQRQIRFLMLLYGKTYIFQEKILESHLMEETYKNDQSDQWFMLI